MDPKFEKKLEKTHKKIQRGIYFSGKTWELDKFIENLKANSQDLLYPEMSFIPVGDPEDDCQDLYVIGWVKKTLEEIQKDKEKAAKIQVAVKARKEKQKQKEIEQLEKLAQKHGFILQTETKI